jgi:hypothetical protein
MQLPSWLIVVDHEVAQIISLVCIGTSVVQLLPTISRVVRRRDTAWLPFWPHLIEALWRWWFCAYLWIVVRSRRPLGHAPVEGWLAGRDRVDLFLYGDTVLLALKLWAMLGPRMLTRSGAMAAPARPPGPHIYIGFPLDSRR